MRLAVKFLSLILVAVVIAIAVDGYIAYRGQVVLFERDRETDATLVADALRPLVGEVWAREGRERALELVGAVDRSLPGLGVHWVSLDTGPREARPDAPPDFVLDSLARGQRARFRAPGADGEEHTWTYFPVTVGTDLVGALEISQPRAVREDFKLGVIGRTARLTAILIGTSSLLAIVFGVLLIGRPLRRLTDKARRIGEGDLSGPVHVRGRNELSSLAETMNEMCDRLAGALAAVHAEAASRIEVVEQLRHSDRLRTVGTLAAGIAHELGTPLNVVSGRASQIASGDLSDAEVSENATIIRDQAHRMAGIIRQLLGFSRAPSAHKEPLDLVPLLERCVGMVSPMARGRGVALESHHEEPAAWVRGDSDELQQVTMNLIVNALHAAADGGNVDVRSHREPGRVDGPSAAADSWVVVEVRDDGPGIPEEHIERLFEPFFTTKDVGEGTGLGLSVAHGIVADHRGWIDVTSEVGKGSCFSVHLPEADAWPAES